MGKLPHKRLQQILDFLDPGVFRLETAQSDERMIREDGSLRPLFPAISLETGKGEIWGFFGHDPLELSLLLEKFSRIGSAHGIAAHSSFYLASSDLLPPHVKLLEAAMQVTRKMPSDLILRQETLLDELISLGLGQLSLTLVSRMSQEERALSSLYVAAKTPAPLIFFNLPALGFDLTQTASLEALARLISRGGRTLVLSTTDSQVVETVCDHTAFLLDGQLVFQGSVDELLSRHDPTLFEIEGDRLDLLKDRLTATFPGLNLNLEEGRLILEADKNHPVDQAVLLEVIGRTGIPAPDRITAAKSARRAFQALERAHAL